MNQQLTEFSDVPRQKLWEIIARYGRDVCDDPRRCEGLLRDLCHNQYRLEIGLLVNALKDDVPKNLLSSKQDLPTHTLLVQLARKLQGDYALIGEAAQWAVISWALALGIIADVPALQNAAPPLWNNSLPKVDVQNPKVEARPTPKITRLDAEVVRPSAQVNITENLTTQPSVSYGALVVRGFTMSTVTSAILSFLSVMFSSSSRPTATISFLWLGGLILATSWVVRLVQRKKSGCVSVLLGLATSSFGIIIGALLGFAAGVVLTLVLQS